MSPERTPPATGRMPGGWTWLPALALGLGAACLAFAQEPPVLSAQQIIEQLAPAASAAAPARMPAAAPDAARSTGPAGAADTATAADPAEQAAAAAAAPTANRARRNLRPVARRIDLQIAFDFNASSLTAQGQEPLRQLALAMLSEQLLHTRFRIEGHTDAKGSASYNLRLSELRARAVADYLVSQGVAARRLQSLGLGFSEPLPGLDPLAPQNRRVRIVALD